MNQYFGTQYSQEEDLQRRLAQRQRVAAPSPARAASLSMLPQQHTQPGNHHNSESAPTSASTGMDMLGGDSLDDIIMQNNHALQRRQSLPRAYPDRRLSMMEFGGSMNGDLNGFQFAASSSIPAGDPRLRRQSTGEVDLSGGFMDLGPGMNMGGQQMGYSAAMQNPGSLAIDSGGAFANMSNEMVESMMGYGGMGVEGISEEDASGMMYSPDDFSQQFGDGNLEAMSNDYIMMENMRDGISSQQNRLRNIEDENNTNSPRHMSMNQGSVTYSTPATPHMSISTPKQTSSYNNISQQGPAPPKSTTELSVKQEPLPNYNNIYSASGFDMLGALMKVATRENPEIDIGKVDMSCAFVVCDLTQSDCPIVYVSDIFERLTGYTKYEVLGRNCRFLQSPEGKVQAGVPRDFCDNESVYYLKKRILAKKEAQRSLINYRKGGQPFMNLLTMIPITGEDGHEMKYIVGFQVDLVEKPTSIENKNANGMYSVDYSQGTLPRYVWQPPEGQRSNSELGQLLSRDDVSTVLSSINSSRDSDITKRMWDRVLLENTDDVVHVLSLKGLFLYLSPSCRQVLEYDPAELVGTALSSVCHPSDIVPVTRELKDTSTGAAVNVVFRIRRKKSGYTWFESHGSLCVEQGKGRKCIILVGRERPVYALARHDIDGAGGIGESEIWTKISTSGMFLFVSASIRTLLDRSPEDMVGTSIQALMRSESRVEFGRSLEKARTGKRVTHKHEVLNKRGLVLLAQTTLYPGDASEGQKPTFLVAQTRLLRSSTRTVAPAVGSHASGKSVNSDSAATTTKHEFRLDNNSSSATNNKSSQLRSDAPAPLPNGSNSDLGPVTSAGGAGLAIGTQDLALASEDNIFDELRTTRCTSWQFELRQMEKSNRLLAEELASLLASKKKRKRRKGNGQLQRDCANCHTRTTPEWRRGPSGQRDLCNSCGLRWAKQTGRVSPRASTRCGDGSKHSQNSTSPIHSSPLQNEIHQQSLSNTINSNPATGNGRGDMHGFMGAIRDLGMTVGLPERGIPGTNLSNLGIIGGRVDGVAINAGGTVSGSGNVESASPAAYMGNSGKTATPGSLGGRTTLESQPVHERSRGFREGGGRGITNIDE